MKPSGWAALALITILPAPTRADFAPVIGPALNGWVGSSVNARFRLPYASFRVARVSVFPPVGAGYLGGYPVLPAYAGVVPWGGYGPLWGYPYLGAYNPYGFYGLSPLVLPPVVIAAPPNDLGLPIVPPFPPAAVGNPPPRGDGAMRGEAAGRFRPVVPLDRERAREPVRVEAPPPRPVTPPVTNPLAQHDILSQAGRRAFAASEYGRAAELFRQATTTAPAIGSSYFLLAQAQLALGKYPESVATIHHGLARQTDWPTSGQPLLELYAGDANAYAEHLQRLEDAAAARPGDPTLDFLRAYVRWFDGRRAEARLLFQQLRDRVARPEVLEQFLQAPSD